jgi:hypothetical protein
MNLAKCRTPAQAGQRQRRQSLFELTMHDRASRRCDMPAWLSSLLLCLVFIMVLLMFVGIHL